ncbi:ATP-binding protein [Rheinheimera gaetbuli]
MRGTLRQKIFAGLIAVAGLAMLIGLVPLYWLMQNSYQQQLIISSHTQARILAEMSTASLLFEQPQSANDILATLSASPDVQRAILFRLSEDKLTTFAEYGSVSDENLAQPTGNTQNTYITDKFLHFSIPVQLQEQTLGSLFMKVSLHRIKDEVRNAATIAGAAILLALLITFWLARQLSNSLLSPIYQLRKVITVVTANQDYSQRVKDKFAAELGELVDAFNTMLDVITAYNRQRKENEEKVVKLNLELEQRVYERTLQLTESINNLKTTQMKLIEQEKLASLGSLVAGVAHEINTPVGVAVTASSHLHYVLQQSQAEFQKGTLSKQSLQNFYREMHESADIISRNLDRAAEQITSFKMVAVDQSSEETRVFMLKDYVEQIILSLRPHFKNTQHRVELDISEALKLDSYPGYFSQIFTNLLMNSLIHGFADKNDGKILVKAVLNGSSLNIDYYDNGKGIDPKVKTKIFDPFVTTNRHNGGSGLGTYILYNMITQALKGHIVLKEDVDEGVHFLITIPITPVEK